MPNAADTLVKKYPDRISQLKGPVYDYLVREAPFKKTDQDLYMAVFRPTARSVPPSTVFPKDVRRDNPGIVTVQDYIDKVNAIGARQPVKLSPSEETALQALANKLGASRDSLYKMIYFESKWNPQARNPVSGARGLIQFMPSTARGMGFKGSIGIGTLLLLYGGYRVFKKIFLRRK
jgi:soluble lytic murein transglycosylase-like protein